MDMLLSNLTSLGSHAPVLAALPMLLARRPLAAEPFEGLPPGLRSEAFAEDLLDDEAYAANGL
ncbi:hypothetical protein [Caldimonas sp. KR1-144]|uniref:hypothetical protein n=1 Tax=Caldimonas sp. KR1-144 TaxID=3400911 RepID=UPI003C0DF7C7